MFLEFQESLESLEVPEVLEALEVLEDHWVQVALSSFLKNRNQYYICSQEYIVRGVLLGVLETYNDTKSAL